MTTKRTMSVSDAGYLGGKARVANMTPEQRSESSRKAAQARWKKYRKAKQNGGVDRER